MMTLTTFPKQGRKYLLHSPECQGARISGLHRKHRENKQGTEIEHAHNNKANSSAPSTTHASIVYDPLSQQLEKKCKDLEFEATCQARQTSLRGELESKLREASLALELAEGRAADLAKRLADRESTSSTLQLRLKVPRIRTNTHIGSPHISRMCLENNCFSSDFYV